MRPGSRRERKRHQYVRLINGQSPLQMIDQLNTNTLKNNKVAVDEQLEYILKKLLTKQSIQDPTSDVVQKILQRPHIYLYMENKPKYRNIIYDFYCKKLSSLYQRYNDCAVPEKFDVESEEELVVWCNLLRFIILRNTRVNYDDLRFLLAIPALRQLAHAPMDNNKLSELLQLALRAGNHYAKKLLLSIPESSIAESYQELRALIINGDSEAIAHFPERVLNWLIPQNRYELARLAVSDINTLRALFRAAPDLVPSILGGEDCLVFLAAVKEGTPQVVEFLLKTDSKLVPTLLRANNYAAFLEAAKNNAHDKLAIMLNIGRKLGAIDFAVLLRTENFTLFHEALANQDDELLTLYMKAALRADTYSGCLGFTMLASRNYHAFRQALMDYKEAIRILITYGFYMATNSNLLSWLKPCYKNRDQEDAVWLAYLFKDASLRSSMMQDDVLLHNPAIFACISKYYFGEYKERLYVFVASKIEEWVGCQSQTTFTFDVRERSLIKELMQFAIIHRLADFARLVKIPAFTMHPYHGNALLRLALQHHNENAVQLLRQVLAVEEDVTVSKGSFFTAKALLGVNRETDCSSYLTSWPKSHQ